MGCPIFEKSNEIKDLIDKILEERDDLFADLKQHFWSGMVSCGLRTDKDAPKKQKWTLKIEGIRGPKTLLDVDKKYIIWGYRSVWSKCPIEKKIAHVMNMLIRIEYPTPDELQKLADKGEEYEMGKLRRPDVQDFRTFLVALGIDWSDDSSLVPSMIDDKTISI